MTDYKYSPPAIIAESLSPGRSAPEGTAQAAGSAWGTVVIVTNVLVAIVLIVGMVVDGKSVAISVVSGVTYYGASTGLFILIASGSLADMWRTWLYAGTERERIVAQADVLELHLKWQIAQAHPQPAPQLEGRHTPHTPPALGRFVHPEPPPDVQKAALKWARQHYDAQGHPDPSMVHPDGRVRRGTIGSARTGASARDKEAKEWLLQKGVIGAVPGGYAIDLSTYPTWAHARQLYNPHPVV
jgi:hypothetical protein